MPPNIDPDIADLLERSSSFRASSAATLSRNSPASAFTAAFSMRRDMTVERFRASMPASARSLRSRAASFSSATKADRLYDRHDEFFLLLNEKAVRLFAFDNGQAFEPDYVLFLRRKGADVSTVQQLFIEPKGHQLKQIDSWQ